MKNFSDVLNSHWASEAIQAASQAGLLSGYADGTFRPDSAITREEMAAMLSRFAAFPACVMGADNGTS